MRAPIGSVVELVGPDGARLFFARHLFGETAREFHVIVRIFVRHGGNFDHFRREQAQRVLLFLALRVGNDDDGAEAHRVGDDGKTDAGVAGGSFHDHPTRS